MYSDENRFEGNVFSDNAAGAALMYSKGLTLARNRFVANRGHRAYGLLLQSVDDSLISANEIAGNTLGLFLENGHANRLLGNRVAGNHVGIRVSDSSDANVFAGNRFTGNIHPVETAGDNRANQWAADGRGNHWDGAATLPPGNVVKLGDQIWVKAGTLANPPLPPPGWQTVALERRPTDRDEITGVFRR
jgi:nitrous oxidase accessory protein